MLETNLKQGLKIQIEILSDTHTRRYSGRIEDTDQDSISVLLSLSDADEKAGIQIGTKCRVAFSMAGKTYAFDTEVGAIQSNASTQSVIFPRPESFYEWTRQYLRLDMSVWIRYTVVPREEMDARIDQPMRGYTQTLNISGGGLRIPPTHSLSIGSILELEIDIPTELEPVLAIGKVSHIDESGCGIEFLLIQEPDRSRIVKHIFKHDRLSRQQRNMKHEENEQASEQGDG